MSTTSTFPSDVSYQSMMDKYDVWTGAEFVPSKHKRIDDSHSRRELASIFRCFGDLPARSRVLDLPCGRGRLTRFLVERGYRVTAADAAEVRVNKAKEFFREYQTQQGGKAPPVEFEVRNLMATGYADDEFDGVACVRLFHHLGDTEVRRRALGELRRICRGRIVLSFRNSFAIDYGKYWLQHRLERFKKHRRAAYDCVLPISMKQFATEIADAGLQIDDDAPVFWPFSSQWYLSLSRSQAATDSARENAA